MQLTVLVDNNTYIDRYFKAEPGLSIFIEEGATRILFDLGYSAIFLENAQRLAIDLRHLDYLVLSHGHLDHSWGLPELLRFYLESSIEGVPLRKPRFLAHPDVFLSRAFGPLPEIGGLLDEAALRRQFETTLSRDPVWLTERLVFLGHIPRKHPFEGKTSLGALADGREDFIEEDTALAYKSDQGLVLIAGCAHAGICNMVDHAREVCQEDRVIDIIGGLHLLDPPPEQLQGTAAYLAGLSLPALHACHCTDLFSKIALAQAAPLREVGVGLRLSYE